MQRLLTYATVLILVAAPAPGLGQLDPLYSLYMFDKVLINPAFAGSSNWVVGTIKYREQARAF